MLQELLAHADAVVRDLDAQMDKALLIQGFLGAEADRAAVRRVLDGVGEDVDQHLPDMQLAADEIGMPERADLLGEGEIALNDLPLHDVAAGLQQYAQIKGIVEQLHAAGLDLGHVQHIVDERQQVGGCAPHLGKAVPDAGLILKVFLGNIQHAHDAVDGGADVVGHVGQELSLGGAGLLGTVQGSLGQIAEAARAHRKHHADIGDDHAEHNEHHKEGVLVGQAHQREFLLAQIDILIGQRYDIGTGQAVHALVQHAEQKYIIVSAHADAEAAAFIAEHRAQLVILVVKDGALGLIGVGVAGVRIAAAHSRQTVVKGICVFYI